MKTLSWDSINPATGTPYTWGDPNLRWGSPSYVLEPGDPGYTPTANDSVSKHKHTTKTKMKHNNYYPMSAAEQIVWLGNFWNKIRGHAAVLGITQAACDAAVADARWVIYVLGSWLPNERAHGKSATQSVQEVLYGTAPGAYVLTPHLPPPLPPADATAVPPLPAVVATPAGALNRIFDLVQEIKQSDTYTEAIGQDLRVIGSETGAPDFNVLAPVLTVSISGGVVNIAWGWQGYSKFLDMLEIQVDRGNGWTTLTFDTTPGYTDTTPHPATLTLWKYRAIFRVSDHQVGQWSAIVTATVGV